MAQHDMNIANQSFPSFRTDLNNALSAINTMHSGTSRPSGAAAGTMWLDTTSASSPTIKFFDGSDDISFATIDYSANTVNFLDSTVVADLVGDTSPQLGGNLDVNGNQIVSVSNGDIVFNPNGTGKAKVGSDVIKTSGKETIWIPAVAMYPNTTNGAEANQVELSNGPELKVLDFDKDSDEFAQFGVAFPKSWNAGTVTFQAFFTATSTNTGTTAWGLSAVALADNGDLNTAFGTQVVATAKAHSGTSNDLDVTAESGAVTIAGSPADDEYVFFQISRDVSADSLTADARLLGIKLFYTTDSANDS